MELHDELQNNTQDNYFVLYNNHYNDNTAIQYLFDYIVVPILFLIFFFHHYRNFHAFHDIVCTP